MTTTAGNTKETRKTFMNDRSAKRRARGKGKISENTLRMQEDYVKQGYVNIAEIAFLMANDCYEDLLAIAAEYGITSKEYADAFHQTNRAVSTALPYFAMPVKPEMIKEEEEITPEVVEDALRNMLAKKR